MDTQANKPHRSDEQLVDGGTNDIYNIHNIHVEYLYPTVPSYAHRIVKQIEYIIHIH